MSLPVLTKKKNKVFISQAMQHATPEQVHRERDGIIRKLRQVYPEHEFEMIEQYHVAEPAEWKDKSPRELRWARLARSIDMMSHADIIVFAESMMTTTSPGCQAEHTVAMSYKTEYDPDEYVVIHEAKLNRYIKEKDINMLHKNIIDCVEYDIKIFTEYFDELISIINRFIPLNDIDNITVNDTTDCWYIERSFHPYYFCAELRKCCVIDEEDYDNGEFFTFVFEFGYKEKDTSRIIIKSFNDGKTKGLKLHEYSLSDNTTIPITLFEALKEACETQDH